MRQILRASCAMLMIFLFACGDVQPNTPDASGFDAQPGASDGSVADTDSGVPDAALLPPDATPLPPDATTPTPLSDVFDESPGTNTYFGALTAGNWTSGLLDLSPSAGAQVLASAYSNSSGLGVAKKFSSTIQDASYAVSFQYCFYADQVPVPFSDFTTLYIGGPAGVMSWTSTPTPTVSGQWVTWKGTYTPAASEIGTDFEFKAVWNFVGQSGRSIAIDGDVTATPIL